MKRNYSYFIIKPDGIRFLDDICEMIQTKYQSVRYYAIDDYEEVIKKLYYKHFETKGEKFAKSFQAYLWGLREFFGNYAVMALVADNRRGYEELVQDIFETKLEVRDKYVNNNIGIVTNYGEGQKNYIKIVDEDGSEKTPRIMNTLGTHRISDINTIHCPDPDKKVTLEELKILLDQGIIDDKNMITELTMNQMKKYKTAKFQEDMREKDYKWPLQPDISGFIKSEIQQKSDEEWTH